MLWKVYNLLYVIGMLNVYCCRYVHVHMTHSNYIRYTIIVGVNLAVLAC